MRASSRLELVEREMEVKTHEMSKMPPSPRHAEMNAELEALHEARDQLRVECTELQSKTNDDLSDDESRRYAICTICAV